MNIIDEAKAEFLRVLDGHHVQPDPTEALRAAIERAVRRCAQVVQENADSNTQAMLRAGIADEILRAAGLEGTP